MKTNAEDSKSDVEVMAAEIPEPRWLEGAKRFVHTVLEKLEYSRWELSLVFCNDEYIRTLNRDYRGKDNATDVLSFAQISDPGQIPPDEAFYAGDIVISLETLAENARYFSVQEEEELKRLIIHGILHLGGWDHSDNSPEQEMLQLQEQVLHSLSEENIY